MSLQKGDKANFATLQRAAREGMLCIMDCLNPAGEKRAVVCAVNMTRTGDAVSYEMVPLAEMVSAPNPYDYYTTPLMDGSEETARAN